MAVTSAAAGSGRIIPSKATLAHTGAGQFTIQNYSSILNYNLSVTAGSVSRTEAVITLSGASTAEVTVTASSPKGGSAAPSKGYRKPLAYTPDTRYTVHENIGECGPGPDCSCHPGWGPHWDTDPQLGSVNPHCSRDATYGSAPVLINEPGYTQANGEWGKVE